MYFTSLLDPDRPGPCADCKEVAYCRVDCGLAPWNMIPEEPYTSLPHTNRFGYLRRMVRWVGGRFALDRYWIRWTPSAPRWGAQLW